MPEWCVALILALASLLWSFAAITASPALANLGEWTYVDYSYRLAEGELPVQGDELTEYVREAWSCRGMDGALRGETPPPCEDVADSAVTDWPIAGENYNAFHPPLYFGFAAGIAKSLEAVGVDFIDGARIASALLAAIGTAWLYYAIRLWDVRRRNAIGATLIALSTPTIAHAAAIVHNDAISMIAGAAAVWLAARIFKHHNHGWILPFTIAALITLTRTLSVVAVLGVGVLVFFVALFSAGERWTRLKPALAIVAGTFLPYVAWTVFQNGRRPEGYVPAIDGLSTDTFVMGDIPAVINTIIGAGAPWGLTSPSSHWSMHPDLTSGLLEGWSWLLYAAFLILIPIALYIWIKGSGPIRHLAALVIILPVTTALVVQVREILSNDSFFRAVPGRYAITAVPMYAAFLGALPDRLPKDWILPALGAAGYAALIASPFV